MKVKIVNKAQHWHKHGRHKFTGFIAMLRNKDSEARSKQRKQEWYSTIGDLFKRK